jgi:hypothetical protein
LLQISWALFQVSRGALLPGLSGVPWRQSEKALFCHRFKIEAFEANLSVSARVSSQNGAVDGSHSQQDYGAAGFLCKRRCAIS